MNPFTQAPIQTPITDLRQGNSIPSGNLTFPWQGWINQLFFRVSSSPVLAFSTQANLAKLTASLGNADMGLLVDVTDFGHILRWTGSAWTWGPGEGGSGFFVGFAVAPTGSGWHVCDGSVVSYLKADGTTGTVTLPNTAGSAAYQRNAAAYAAAITAAVAPTTGAASASVAVQSGAGTTVATAGHNHAVSLPGDPVANFSAMLYFRQ